jgi:hypothetical protein
MNAGSSSRLGQRQPNQQYAPKTALSSWYSQSEASSALHTPTVKDRNTRQTNV